MARRGQPVASRRRVAELRTAGGFLRGLGPFLAGPLAGPHESEGELGDRERRFAGLLQRAVFGRPESPYRQLLDWAAIEPGDVVQLLAEEGLDATLERLCDAGVYVTLEEFKGWQPIVRPGLELPLSAAHFDNPLLERRYPARTGGSTGAARSIGVDLELLEYESAFHRAFYAATGTTGRPLGIWHPAPPGAVGIKTALIQARLGWPAERWFSQSRLHGGSLKHALFTRAARTAARLGGGHVPRPRFTPAREAVRVARWLATRHAQGTPAILVTTPSACVRTCRAALENGLDIAGSFFVLVGEPYTPAKAELVAAAGCRAASHYAMSETGLIGVACQAAENPDDVHLLTDKIATIERERLVGAAAVRVGALFHTTLLAASPKLMLNVESGDFGVRERHACGCGVVAGRLDVHLHTIRSYEKLTSEGMSFLGGELVRLVEHVLPSRFGGLPTDYQFVEREQDGLPRVSLIVRPAVGDIDDEQVLHAVLDFLRDRGPGQEMMVGVWSQSGTLRIVRGEPHETPGGKVLALQTLAG
jgi:hypothetical protein